MPWCGEYPRTGILGGVSRENVEIVRRIYASWVPGSSPAETNLLDPGIEWVNPSAAIEPGTRTGLDAFTAITEELDETIGELHMDVERLVDAGSRVAVIATMRGRGGASGVGVERRHGAVWSIRDGKAVRFEWFYEADEALRAVGVSG
jgi:uncharacterized protein